ncbi:hypothetical protein CEXT_761651 [Caerostris extrusa]|uniref:Uncharacterized protein n=1 Tax=Caerostris extrusa TaxID=172846 RepID=A0AAV4UHQ3_CAEEX|nr:hypothetical protein CEXT_761651 [Caerostris extrusa]
MSCETALFQLRSLGRGEGEGVGGASASSLWTSPERLITYGGHQCCIYSQRQSALRTSMMWWQVTSANAM